MLPGLKDHSDNKPRVPVNHTWATGKNRVCDIALLVGIFLERRLAFRPRRRTNRETSESYAINVRRTWSWSMLQFHARDSFDEECQLHWSRDWASAADDWSSCLRVAIEYMSTSTHFSISQISVLILVLSTHPWVRVQYSCTHESTQSFQMMYNHPLDAWYRERHIIWAFYLTLNLRISSFESLLSIHVTHCQSGILHNQELTWLLMQLLKWLEGAVLSKEHIQTYK